MNYDNLSPDELLSSIESIAGSMPPMVDPARIAQRALDRIAQAQPEMPNRSQPAKSWKRWVSRTGLLAAACLIFGFIYAWDGVARSMRAPTTTESYATGRAERKDVKLSDGSQVVLGPDTRMTFTVVNGAERKVTLVGQAYFSVTQNKEQTFTVRAGKVITKVLGTSFVVRAYSTDRITQVAVADGKVTIGFENRNATVISAGNIGSVQTTGYGSTTVMRNTNLSDATAWMRGELVFNHVPLREAVPDLERTYGVNIKIANDELAGRLIKLRLTSQSPKDMIQALTTILGAKVEQRGSSITFYTGEKAK